jgi:hypothetical protein
MAFISLKDFLSIWHFKLIGLIGPRAVSERVNELRFSLGGEERVREEARSSDFG